MYNCQGEMFNCYKTQLKYLSNVWPSHAKTCREGKHSILTLKFPDIMTTISYDINVDILLCLVNSERSTEQICQPELDSASFRGWVLPLMIWRLDIAQNHESLRVTSEDDSCFAWWCDFFFISWFPTSSSIRSKSVDVNWTCDTRQLPWY